MTNFNSFVMALPSRSSLATTQGTGSSSSGSGVVYSPSQSSSPVPSPVPASVPVEPEKYLPSGQSNPEFAAFNAKNQVDAATGFNVNLQRAVDTESAYSGPVSGAGSEVVTGYPVKSDNLGGIAVLSQQQTIYKTPVPGTQNEYAMGAAGTVYATASGERFVISPGGSLLKAGELSASMSVPLQTMGDREPVSFEATPRLVELSKSLGMDASGLEVGKTYSTSFADYNSPQFQYLLTGDVKFLDKLSGGGQGFSSLKGIVFVSKSEKGFEVGLPSDSGFSTSNFNMVLEKTGVFGLGVPKIDLYKELPKPEQFNSNQIGLDFKTNINGISTSNRATLSDVEMKSQWNQNADIRGKVALEESKWTLNEQNYRLEQQIVGLRYQGKTDILSMASERIAGYQTEFKYKPAVLATNLVVTGAALAGASVIAMEVAGPVAVLGLNSAVALGPAALTYKDTGNADLSIKTAALDIATLGVFYGAFKGAGYIGGKVVGKIWPVKSSISVNSVVYDELPVNGVYSGSQVSGAVASGKLPFMKPVLVESVFDAPVVTVAGKQVFGVSAASVSPDVMQVVSRGKLTNTFYNGGKLSGEATSFQEVLTVNRDISNAYGVYNRVPTNMGGTFATTKGVAGEGVVTILSQSKVSPFDVLTGKVQKFTYSVSTGLKSASSVSVPRISRAIEVKVDIPNSKVGAVDLLGKGQVNGVWEFNPELSGSSSKTVAVVKPFADLGGKVHTGDFGGKISDFFELKTPKGVEYSQVSQGVKLIKGFKEFTGREPPKVEPFKLIESPKVEVSKPSSMESFLESAKEQKAVTSSIDQNSKLMRYQFGELDVKVNTQGDTAFIEHVQNVKGQGRHYIEGNVDAFINDLKARTGASNVALTPKAPKLVKYYADVFSGRSDVKVTNRPLSGEVSGFGEGQVQVQSVKSLNRALSESGMGQLAQLNAVSGVRSVYSSQITEMGANFGLRMGAGFSGVSKSLNLNVEKSLLSNSFALLSKQVSMVDYSSSMALRNVQVLSLKNVVGSSVLHGKPQSGGGGGVPQLIGFSIQGFKALSGNQGVGEVSPFVSKNIVAVKAVEVYPYKNVFSSTNAVFNPVKEVIVPPAFKFAPLLPPSHNWFGASGGSSWFKRLQRSFSYTPSQAANIWRVRGPHLKGVLSGATIRPLPSLGKMRRRKK